ncbi:MAG: hypothetical protein AAGF26_18915 [Cyanobacteria bacterium P01_G01_bin.49]
MSNNAELSDSSIDHAIALFLRVLLKRNSYKEDRSILMNLTVGQ